MSCYVDDARNPFGRYLMCHLWADSVDELYALQRPPQASWTHFDITQSKRALALAAGAIATDRYGPLEHVARLAGDDAAIARIAETRLRHAAEVLL